MKVCSRCCADIHGTWYSTATEILCMKCGANNLGFPQAVHMVAPQMPQRYIVAGHCRECKWWTVAGANRKNWGVCSSLNEDFVAVDYMGDLWCSGDFGCIKFEKLEG